MEWAGAGGVWAASLRGEYQKRRLSYYCSAGVHGRVKAINVFRHGLSGYLEDIETVRPSLVASSGKLS